ncbi:MAG: biotin--[acetyl-CoA-carboxylase] ligase [Acidobacteriota bacterium]|nr:biotin--[acetyl-CoA-carboxylase] ligase [Acidobacteriota bacterium]
MADRSEAFDQFTGELLAWSPPLPGNLVLMDTVDSTNRFVKALVERSFEEELTPPAALVVAFEQTAGRGRQGRSWVSTAGRGLYCTRLQPLPIAGAGPLEDQLGALPLLAGIGVCRALTGFVDGRARLKWPNDVLVDDRKIAGILIETVVGKGGETVALIGFGVNYDFGEAGELPTPVATSIALETGKRPSRAAVAARLAASLEAELGRAGDVEYTLDAYRRCTVHREGDEVSCRIGGETVSGRFAGFDEGGRFRLRTSAGLRTIASGEVIEA